MGLLRNKLTEVGEIFLENMLNLGSKTLPNSQIFSVPSNFRNHHWGIETGAFP